VRNVQCSYLVKVRSDTRMKPSVLASGHFTSFCWSCFGNSSGRGARIKVLRKLSYENKRPKEN
jgi:hypothetical protein